MNAHETSATNNYVTRWQDAAERPTGFRRRLRSFLRSRYLDVISRLPTNPPAHYAKGLCCHYVFDNQLKSFEQLIVAIRARGRFISTDQYVRMAEGTETIDGACFHLSFDDGFRNVVTNALPILEKHAVPFAFFIPTDCIGADFTQATQFCSRESYRGPVEFASWDNLRRLDPELVTLGSHTVTHPQLASISHDGERLHHELAASKARLEQELDRPCEYLAWPRGQPHDIDRATIEVARNCGYRALFGAHGGTVLPDQPHDLVMPRQHFELQWPLSHIAYLAARKNSHRKMA